MQLYASNIQETEAKMPLYELLSHIYIICYCQASHEQRVQYQESAILVPNNTSVKIILILYNNSINKNFIF